LKTLLRSAEGGTLFVETIDECSTGVQSALVRAIDDQRERRVPGRQAKRAGVHFVLAGEAAVPEAAALRLDEGLRARLEAVITVPPLRARRTDVLVTARVAATEQGKSLSITPDAAEALVAWSWPRNAREVRELVRSFVLVTNGAASLDLPYLDEAHPAIAAPIVGRRDGTKKDAPSSK
jgi:DNA-binding NtrC family response regulator